jgi:hypothetical protein
MIHDYPSHKFPQTKVPPFACESRGLMAWLWLFTIPSQARPKPSWSCHFGPAWLGLFGPGLAWLTASGRAMHSTMYGSWARQPTLSLRWTDQTGSNMFVAWKWEPKVNTSERIIELLYLHCIEVGMKVRWVKRSVYREGFGLCK